MTAITRSKYHKYQMGKSGPFPGCTAICAMQDSTGGTDGLLNWAVKVSLDEMALAFYQTKDMDRARSRADQAKNKARDLGSDVHAAIDQFNRGQTLTVNAETGPYIAHYAAWVRNNNVEIVGSEKYVINTEIGFGGTYDSLCRIDGELALVDVKTGSQKVSQRLQLAGLSMAELHGEEGEEPEPMPKVDVGYILLVRPDTAPELIRHEITDADREHFRFLVETYHRVRGWADQFTPTALKEAA